MVKNHYICIIEIKQLKQTTMKKTLFLSLIFGLFLLTLNSCSKKKETLAPVFTFCGTWNQIYSNNIFESDTIKFDCGSETRYDKKLNLTETYQRINDSIILISPNYWKLTFSSDKDTMFYNKSNINYETINNGYPYNILVRIQSF